MRNVFSMLEDQQSEHVPATGVPWYREMIESVHTYILMYKCKQSKCNDLVQQVVKDYRRKQNHSDFLIGSTGKFIVIELSTCTLAGEYAERVHS